MRPIRWTAFALLVLTAAAGPPAPASAQACLSGDELRTAVAGGYAVPFSQLTARVGSAGGGKVVSAQLCQAGGRYVYIVNVLSSGGSVRRLTVDARSGSILN